MAVYQSTNMYVCKFEQIFVRKRMPKDLTQER